MSQSARIACAMSIVCLAAGHARAAAPAIEWLGRGVQIYGCVASGDGFAWLLKAPEAVLLDAQEHQAGRHFAGPSWQADDGSLVTGEVLVASGGDPGAIPWLVLRAESHTGAGVLATVRNIVRSRTQGGLAPAGGCDKDHRDAEARVPYQALYTFFPDGVAAPP